MQKYDLKENPDAANLSGKIELVIDKDISAGWFEKPKGLKVVKANNTGRVFLSYTRNICQERVLSESGLEALVSYTALLKKKDCGEDGRKYALREDKEGHFSLLSNTLEAETVYTVKAAAEIKGKEGEFSEEAVFTTQNADFSGHVWKECPGYAEHRRYLVNEATPWTATACDWWCTITGSTHLPLNKVTSWDIRVLNSRNNNGVCIYVGVAPFYIDQSDGENYNRCGWYLYCYNSSLWSGAPHLKRGKEYGPRKWDGEYVRTGNAVGVIMDTKKGDLSFILDDVNLGVAYKGIPLDKPLVSCVILGTKGDSVGLIV